MQTDIEDSTDEQYCVIDLSPLPPEVSDFALDQLEDRLRGPEGERALGQLLADVGLVRDYEAATVELRKSVVGIVVAEAAREKISGINEEIRLGERVDFSEADVERMFETLDRVSPSTVSSLEPNTAGSAEQRAEGK